MQDPCSSTFWGKKLVMSAFPQNHIITNWKAHFPKPQGTSVVHKDNWFPPNCPLDRLHLFFFLSVCKPNKQNLDLGIFWDSIPFLPACISFSLLPPNIHGTHNFLAKICVLMVSLLTCNPYLNARCKIFALSVFLCLP